MNHSWFSRLFSRTIYNVTFEDETDIKVVAKSSTLEKVKVIQPHVLGDPVGQLSLTPDQVPRALPWRQEYNKNKFNVHASGVFERESFRVVCSIRHRADIGQPLNVFIQQSECSVDTCLSDTIEKTCRSPSGQRLPISKGARINAFQTQFVSIDSQILNDPAVGRQYLCCYEQRDPVPLAKGLTALARNELPERRQQARTDTFIFLFFRRPSNVCCAEARIQLGDRRCSDLSPL
jgi:hypothetical protein